MAVQLDTVDDLRVFKFPTDIPNESPTTIIQDVRPVGIAEYLGSTQAVHFLEVLILADLTDSQEAYEELEKYVSADSGSSVKALMDLVSVSGVQSVECTKAGPRKRHEIGGRTYWGCTFSIRAIMT